jgi:redox-sensitive bicupin YhaK (pirin superfamily)
VRSRGFRGTTSVVIPTMSYRRADERGKAEHGWLSSRHTFSFADYYDPRHMGFRALRVINEDRVAPGQGFPTHGHRDMEIVTYVLEGALEHKDSTGTSSVIHPGDVQRMSAGSGVRHSEYNHSQEEPVHFLQIWLLPDTRSIPPSYEQKHFDDADKANRLRLVASSDGADGSVTIHQDVRLFAARLEPGAALDHELPADRYAWIQMARGTTRVSAGEQSFAMSAGDGVAVLSGGRVELAGAGAETAELLLFELA